jgi:hypothetical protein
MINIKPHSCLILITGSHSLIFFGLKARDRSGDEDQTRVRFSYYITYSIFTGLCGYMHDMYAYYTRNTDVHVALTL